MPNSLQEFAQALAQHDRYVIAAHEHPDPDSIGSMLALYHALRQRGKQCWMLCADPLPGLSWPGIEDIRPWHESMDIQAGVILDCEPERTGPVLPIIQEASVTFNIDHHQGNPGGGDYNVVDTSQAATAMIVYDLLPVMQVTLDASISQCLYGGIVGDTGGFRYANTTDRVLMAAADLVGHGANPALTAREIFECKPLAFVHFLGYCLRQIESTENGKVVWLALSLDDFCEFGIDPSTSDQIIQYARMVAGAEIAVLFREVSANEIRIGFRSHTLNIQPLASKFGGGGHKLASGAKVHGHLASIVDQVIDASIAWVTGGCSSWTE